MGKVAADIAIVIGKYMYDCAEGWGEEPPFGVPVFVVTHSEREREVRGDTSFTFVTDGIDSAVERARAAAGDRDVSIGGGASIIRQTLSAGLLDELQIHVAPLLLGAGKRLFDNMEPVQTKLETIRVVESPAVTHLKFRIVR